MISHEARAIQLIADQSPEPSCALGRGDGIVHSVAMGASVMNAQGSRLTVEASAGTHEPSAKFVRLAQLRKLCDCDQVAAICYRVRSGRIEFLLVRTRGSGRWTFPKGSAEPGLTHAQAAALEAFEEAGVHGRIEEASFARYVRRGQDDRRRSVAKSGEKEFAVSAHLCEVSRLSPPKESGRNRTWFSVEDARRCLRKGRRSEDGAEFARVVDRAAARIERLRGGTGIVDRPPKDRPQPHRPHPDGLRRDALQKVQFDFVEAYGWMEEASPMPHIRGRLGGIRQFAVPVADAHAREILQGEVLQFDSARNKKAKALGTGVNHRG
jgi:8-oxo-dGTP pyrophosphatase MutT (NUDIX family)